MSGLSPNIAIGLRFKNKKSGGGGERWWVMFGILYLLSYGLYHLNANLNRKAGC